jgi:hypothetical protein
MFGQCRVKGSPDPLAYTASGAQVLGSGASKDGSPIDDWGLAPPTVIYGEPLPLFDSNRGADPLRLLAGTRFLHRSPRSAWERSSSGLHTVDPDAYRMGGPRPLNQSPFGQTGETSPSRDKLCLGGGPHADGAYCCSCVYRVRIDRGRTRLVRVPAADGQRTSSVTSGGQLVAPVIDHDGNF